MDVNTRLFLAYISYKTLHARMLPAHIKTKSFSDWLGWSCAARFIRGELH